MPIKVKLDANSGAHTVKDCYLVTPEGVKTIRKIVRKNATMPDEWCTVYTYDRLYLKGNLNLHGFDEDEYPSNAKLIDDLVGYCRITFYGKTGNKLSYTYYYNGKNYIPLVFKPFKYNSTTGRIEEDIFAINVPPDAYSFELVSENNNYITTRTNYGLRNSDGKYTHHNQVFNFNLYALKYLDLFGIVKVGLNTLSWIQDTNYWVRMWSDERPNPHQYITFNSKGYRVGNSSSQFNTFQEQLGAPYVVYINSPDSQYFKSSSKWKPEIKVMAPTEEQSYVSHDSPCTEVYDYNVGSKVRYSPTSYSLVIGSYPNADRIYGPNVQGVPSHYSSVNVTGYAYGQLCLVDYDLDTNCEMWARFYCLDSNENSEIISICQDAYGAGSWTPLYPEQEE